MLPLDDFLPAVRAAIPRFRAARGRPPAPDAQQEACIVHPTAGALQIVAGPGSGKTTVLVLRALRLVLVDGLLPDNILLTTFTTKAAAEIRTRLIDWGHALVDHLAANPTPALKAHLRQVDVNRFMTGTLDSVCEDALRSMRAPEDAAPVVIENFAANVILHRRGLTGRAYVPGATDPIVPTVATYLSRFTFEGDPPRNVAELTGAVRPLFDRFCHDLVDPQRFAALTSDTAARALLADSYAAYAAEMLTNNRLDFALLEREFLTRLRGNRLTRFTANLRAILVDEYQDTNLLQESIYFELLRASSASLTVVGDDDQSLYRFRGATVELFRDFAPRLTAAAPNAAPARVDLFQNYRSTPEIVAFMNSFVTNDPDFAGARVQPLKPTVVATRPVSQLPVLGLFRSDATTLASDLALFLHDVFRGPGRTIRGVSLIRDPAGDLGDAVFLSHSVNEFGSSFGGRPPKVRLPRLLRDELGTRQLNVFNPRGQHLRDIEDVQCLIGAMLECIDPGAVIQAPMPLRGTGRDYLTRFRQTYQQFASTNPRPTAPHGLADFVGAWAVRRPQVQMAWPREWPLLELCFTLLSWFPRLQNDPEGQVYLEAITRAISQSATFSPFKGLILSTNPLAERSVQSALRDIFAPLAENLIDVDEEIMPSVPRDRLGIMTIHQAKGLEYPLVIVDVSSDYTTNHPKNRFKRFPDAPSNVATLEDDLSGVCDVGPLRQQRQAIQRTFEDLIRLYYVAYSRPQSALLLVGLDKSLQYLSTIRHVATFWRRNETWPWQGPYTTRKPPPQANAVPLELI